MSVESSFTQQSFVADLLSKSDSPHRLLESLSNAIALRANTSLSGSKCAIDGQENSSYVSCLYYNGKPFLPPRLTDAERREMASIRERAVLVEKQVAERKEESRRRLLNYVAQRLEQLDSCSRADKRKRDETRQIGMNFMQEENPGNKGGSSRHNQSAAGTDAFTNASLANVISSKNSPVAVVTEYLDSRPPVDANMTSSFRDISIYNLSETHTLASQTLQTSIKKTTSPSSYFSPDRVRTSRISPRRRLNLNESTDKQYKHTAALRAYPKASARSSARLYAIARGYLTRKLRMCSKVQQLATTIRDLSTFLYSTSPVSSRNTHDSVLQDQVKSQLHAARAAVHSIFFVYGPREQMALIRQSRQMEHKRTLRQTPTTSGDALRLSLATKKAIERRQNRLQSNSLMQPVTPQPAIKAATPTVPSHKVKPSSKSKSAPKREKQASIMTNGKTARSTTTASKQNATSAKSKPAKATWK